MQSAMHLKTPILPGGKIELKNLTVPVGEWVDVFVVVPRFSTTQRRSALDILAEAPGQCQFKTAEEVDTHIREERNSWER